MPVSLASNSAGSAKGALVPIGVFNGNNTTAVMRFTNIPAIYQDLYLVVSGNILTTAGNSISSLLDINADGNSGLYSSTWINGNGATAVSLRGTNANYTENLGPNTMTTQGALGVGNTFPISQIWHILNYANTNTFKTIVNQSAADVSGAGYSILSVSLWRNTNAINSFAVSTFNGNGFWNFGSSGTLYGVRSVGQ
jgi:hypothetical protein